MWIVDRINLSIVLRIYVLNVYKNRINGISPGRTFSVDIPFWKAFADNPLEGTLGLDGWVVRGHRGLVAVRQASQSSPGIGKRVFLVKRDRLFCKMIGVVGGQRRNWHWNYLDTFCCFCPWDSRYINKLTNFLTQQRHSFASWWFFYLVDTQKGPLM